MRQALLALCLLLSGCGGAVGNIESYEYAFSKPALDHHLEQLLRRDLGYPPREIEAIYHVSTNKFTAGHCYLLLSYQDQQLVFGFKTISLGKRSRLALVYAAPLGDVLILPIHQPFWAKWRYATLFETMFLDQLNQKLQAAK